MSEDIKLYRKDSPGGEEISDNLAIQEGYANKEEMAIDLVNNAGYSTSPVLLEDGSGISGGSAALANLTDAESKVQSLIDEFLRNQGSKGVYDSPTAGEPVFTQEDEDYVPTLDEAKNLYPYLPTAVVEVIVNTWKETGEINIALAQARATDDFKAAFPGIARKDGSLRMTETQYIETVDRMQDALRTFNLNPDVFSKDITEAISGDVSAKEFEERLSIGYNQVFNNIPQVQEVYRENFGINLSDEAIFGMFLSPELSEAVLQNQVLVSQIAAEAEVAGVGVGITAAQRFVQEGVSQAEARRLFSQTAQVATGLQATAAATNMAAPTDEQIARGLGGLSVEDLNIIKSIEARALAESSPILGAAQTRTGEVVGLEEA